MFVVQKDIQLRQQADECQSTDSMEVKPAAGALSCSMKNCSCNILLYRNSFTYSEYSNLLKLWPQQF